MNKLLPASAAVILTLGMVAAPTMVHALGIGETLGTDEAAISAALEAQGAVVDEIETEDGVIEVEFVIDGQEMEAEIDLASGNVIAIELDDLDDDEDDDEDDKD